MNAKEEPNTKPLRKKLTIESEVSNPEVYRYDPDERKDKRQYRLDKAMKDIDKRLIDHGRRTGKMYNFEMNRNKVQISALIYLLESKGLFSDIDFSEWFWIAADQSVRIIESNAAKDRAESISKGFGKGLLLPKGASIGKGN